MIFRYFFLFLIINSNFVFSSASISLKHHEAFERRQMLEKERMQKFSHTTFYQKQVRAAQNRERIILKKLEYSKNRSKLFRNYCADVQNSIFCRSWLKKTELPEFYDPLVMGFYMDLLQSDDLEHNVFACTYLCIKSPELLEVVKRHAPDIKNIEVE